MVRGITVITSTSFLFERSQILLVTASVKCCAENEGAKRGKKGHFIFSRGFKCTE